jgi:hypothetical protein
MYLNKKEYKNMEKDYKKADDSYAKMKNPKGDMKYSCSPAAKENYDYLKNVVMDKKSNA